MIFKDLKAQQHELSYDKILKNTLAQSNEMTVRFVNGLFGDDISLDAKVVWLDKESVNDKHTGFVADFYPEVDGKMYSIEVESDDNGDMAVRVFKYAVGGAILHQMKAGNAELNITFPQPCVIFLKSTANTPHMLTWNMNFFDGQKVTLKAPTYRLGEMSIEEIVNRNLLPIGQFYLRSFEPLTKGKVEKFKEAADSLLKELKNAVKQGVVPYYIGEQMQDTIRKTIENTVNKSKEEVDVTMTTNIIETLPWTDYKEFYEKIEERGKTEGRIEERNNALALMKEAKDKGMSIEEVIAKLSAFPIAKSED